ncbi:MAG: energy transducer TonB [Flavipsychrobacter sp.]|nr:energy transducer TonB [Flavipsychrobacter sp.]
MTKSAILITAMLLGAWAAGAQTATLKEPTKGIRTQSSTHELKETKSGDSDIYTYVEQMPEPSVNIGEYLAKNIVYPKDAQDKNITGKVVLKFVVNETGTIQDITVTKPVYPSIDSTAVAVLKKMPKWKPGRSEGKPVKVYYTLPIRFNIDDAPGETKPTPGYDLNAYIKANLRYPNDAMTSKVEGTVIVGFTVKEDGSISGAAVSIGVKPSLDKEALRLVNGMPKWKPATKNGKPTSAYHAQPIVFSIKK